MSRRHVSLALALAFTALPPSAPLSAQETAKEIIAAHIRTQGFKCDRPESVVHQRSASRPDEQAWLIKCRNASYRVLLVPDMAAQVERIGRRLRP